MRNSLSQVKALFLDMDGVLWSGKKDIGNLPEIFRKISAAGLIPLFGTNNSTRTPEAYVRVLQAKGVSVTPAQFFTAGVGAAAQLKADFPDGVRLHILGSDALKELMAANGFTPVDEDADAVLVSLDKQLTYEKIDRAMQLILSGAKFYATNADTVLAAETGWHPGGGVMVKAVETCTGVQPFIIGKPNTVMIDLACRAYGLRPEEIMAVGDRYDTDILGGINYGAWTALVLTGFDSRNSIQRYKVPPDLICENLEALIDLLAAR